MARVWCVSGPEGGALHRFYDTSPFSPSGRFLAFTRLPFEDHLPAAGEAPADIVLTDLETAEQRVIAHSYGWDTQLGAQCQWGATDAELYFNDLDTRRWRPYGVKVDPSSGVRTSLDGTIYGVSPDGRMAASPCLLRTAKTQPGYGVVVPAAAVPSNHGAAADDGISVTDLDDGRSRLLVSFEQILDHLENKDEFRKGAFYGAHVKWAPDGGRLMFVIRWVAAAGGTRRMIVTLRADGTDIRIALPASAWARGHHPNWWPDGEHIVMNLRVSGTMRFVRFRYDGEGRHVLSDRIVGSGHPTVHPSGRYILTDAYPHEPVSAGDGTAPVRLIDLETMTERTVLRIGAAPAFRGPADELRVDLHPAWDRQFMRVALTACPGGTRRLFVADLSELVSR